MCISVTGPHAIDILPVLCRRIVAELLALRQLVGPTERHPIQHTVQRQLRNPVLPPVLVVHLQHSFSKRFQIVTVADTFAEGEVMRQLRRHIVPLSGTGTHTFRHATPNSLLGLPWLLLESTHRRHILRIRPNYVTGRIIVGHHEYLAVSITGDGHANLLRLPPNNLREVARFEGARLPAKHMRLRLLVPVVHRIAATQLNRGRALHTKDILSVPGAAAGLQHSSPGQRVGPLLGVAGQTGTELQVGHLVQPSHLVMRAHTIGGEGGYAGRGHRGDPGGTARNGRGRGQRAIGHGAVKTFLRDKRTATAASAATRDHRRLQQVADAAAVRIISPTTTTSTAAGPGGRSGDGQAAHTRREIGQIVKFGRQLAIDNCVLRAVSPKGLVRL